MHRNKITRADNVADAPDLGAFTTVFRALNTYNHPRTANGSAHFTDSGESARTPTSTFLHSDYDSEAPAGSTVWAHRGIANYLDESDDNDNDNVELAEDEDQPSLGFSGALDFLAAERAKFVAQRDAAGSNIRDLGSTTISDDTWRHAAQTRRRRRRRRNRSHSIQVRRSAAGDGATETTGETETTTNDEDEVGEDSTDSSDVREPARYYESTPSSPPLNATRAGRAQRHHDKDNRPVVHHSRSTPSLRLTASMPIDPRVLQLRNLAHKLRMLFPKDAASLAAVLSDDQPGADDFVDPRGPVPRSKDTLIHVFIDQ